MAREDTTTISGRHVHREACLVRVSVRNTFSAARPARSNSRPAECPRVPGQGSRGATVHGQHQAGSACGGVRRQGPVVHIDIAGVDRGRGTGNGDTTRFVSGAGGPARRRHRAPRAARLPGAGRSGGAQRPRHSLRASRPHRSRRGRVSPRVERRPIKCSGA